MKYFLIIFCLFLVGCIEPNQEKNVQTPEGLLSKEEFISTYIDIRILENGIKSRFTNNQLKKIIATNSVDSILKQKGISRELFSKSFDFYGQNPYLMHEVYSAMLDTLNFRMINFENQSDTLSK